MVDQLEMFESNSFFNKNQELKLCTKCNKNLPLNCFASAGRMRSTDGSFKLLNKCKSCRYLDISVREALKKIVATPNKEYKCPICLRQAKELLFIDDSNTHQINSQWCLDHDHETGNFRGWLCNKCNSALGWLDDDINKLRRALNYLENYANSS
jgi:hypothetical protein